jgi:rhodanese-related sulfurtransferase
MHRKASARFWRSVRLHGRATNTTLAKVSQARWAEKGAPNNTMDDLQISVQDVNARISRGDHVLLVDVREPAEYDLCRLPGATLIPLGALPSNLNKLLDADEVVLYCHHGMRSLDAAIWLRQQGVDKAKSMAGGIERWSLEIDATVPRY